MVGLAGLIYWFNLPAVKPPKKVAKKKIIKKLVKKQLPTDPLDGLPADAAAINRKPLAVMIENLVNIRPQSGLSKASLVVEALSEGGITRFMAVYGSHEADRVGPVRSARKHFVAMAAGIDALYAHAGGSIYALRAIKDWGIDDLDEFAYSQGYERVPGIKAPHNLFTNTQKLRKVKDDSGRSNQVFQFKDDLAVGKRPGAQKVTIGFKEKDYDVAWQYQPASNAYLRYNAGQPHMDALTNTQLTAKNIVVMFTQTSSIPGGGLVLDINVMGAGRLILYRDGEFVEGTWEKSAVTSPVRFLGADGTELKLNRGQTWLEIVPTDTQIGAAATGGP